MTTTKMRVRNYLLFTALFCVCITSVYSENGCSRVSDQCEIDTSVTRYIFAVSSLHFITFVGNISYILFSRFISYDVNSFEGFNLRRDVYMRIAILFNKLKSKGVDWKLVSIFVGSDQRKRCVYFYFIHY